VIEILVILLGYLLGSVPSGYLVGARSGVDVRKAGSGNIGATNVTRVLGKGRGILTLIADTGKGYLAVFIASQMDLALPIVVLAGVAAFVGHLFPIFLNFRGGKGVATAFGVLLALAPLATALLVVVFAATLVSSRIASISSMTAAAAAPVALWLLSYPPVVVSGATVMALLIIVRHHANLKRLLEGTEPRLGANSR
jgi:glycerol-3-phosphate acyltransferase PlsY